MLSSEIANKPLSSRRRTYSALVMFCLVLLLIGSGLALFWDNGQAGHGRAQAADVSVVGPPTLAASTVDGIFARLGSPMRGLGTLIEQMSRQDSIDDAFALGVWWTETNDGEAGVGLADRNPGSVRGSVGYPSAWDGYTIYPSYADAVVYWFNMLRTRYVDEGLSSVYVIARPYVGTSSYPLWAAKVINLMSEYRGLAPPPPASTPKPTPTVNPYVVAVKSAWRGRQTALTQWRAQHNYTPAAYQGETRENARPSPAPPVTSAQELIRMMVSLGLLLALLLALLALRLSKISASRRFTVVVAPVTSTTPVTPAMSALSLPVFAPVADRDKLPLAGRDKPPLAGRDKPPLAGRDKPPLAGRDKPQPLLPSTPPPRLPAYSGASGSPRRVTLRPAPSSRGAPTPVLAAAGERPGGLLSRYGQSGASSHI